MENRRFQVPEWNRLITKVDKKTLDHWKQNIEGNWINCFRHQAQRLPARGTRFDWQPTRPRESDGRVERSSVCQLRRKPHRHAAAETRPHWGSVLGGVHPLPSSRRHCTNSWANRCDPPSYRRLPRDTTPSHQRQRFTTNFLSESLITSLGKLLMYHQEPQQWIYFGTQLIQVVKYVVKWMAVELVSFRKRNLFF